MNTTFAESLKYFGLPAKGKTASELETVTWLGYDFYVYGPDADWNEVGGLYVFALLDRETKEWKPLYVGQARSFAKRLPTHKKWPEAEQLGATYIHALVESREKTRESIEEKLIEYYQPPLNDHHK